MSEAPNGSGEGAEGTEGTGNPAEGQTTDWTAGLDDTWKGYVGVKGWEGPQQMLESYKNLEGHIGVPSERIVKLPGEDAEDGAWDKVYAQMGRPEAANGYEINLPEGMDMDEARSGVIREAAFKAGLTPSQLNILAEADAGFMKEVSDNATASSKAAASSADVELRKEWGAGYDKNANSVEIAAQEFNMSEDQLSALRTAMGPVEAMKFMANIGNKVGAEDGYEGNRDESRGFNSFTPAEAKAQIEELNLNPEFMKKYMAGDSAALTRMTHLHSLAHGGA